MTKTQRPSGENALLWIMAAETKRDLVDRCRDNPVSEKELATLIFACQNERAEVVHRSYFARTVPEHLHLTESDRADMANINGRKPKEIRGFRKIFAQIDETQHRCFHLFAAVLSDRWWLVYFSMKDAAEYGNHWDEGCHVHLLCWLTHPKANCTTFFNQVRNDPSSKLPSGIHVRSIRRQSGGPERGEEANRSPARSPKSSFENPSS